MDDFIGKIAKRARDVLVVRCKLVSRSIGWMELGVRVSIELLCSQRHHDGIHFWNIRYTDELQTADVPRQIYFIAEDLGVESPQYISAQLLPNIRGVVTRWEKECPPWAKDDAEVVAWGNPGQDRGAMRQITPSHLCLIQHYGALRVLIAQRMLDSKTPDPEQLVLHVTFNRLEGFLRSRFSEWDAVRETLGLMT